MTARLAYHLASQHSPRIIETKNVDAASAGAGFARALLEAGKLSDERYAEVAAKLKAATVSAQAADERCALTSFNAGRYSGKKEHEAACRSNTGWEIDLEGWLDRYNRRQELDRQTARIADALERAGVWSRSDNDITAISAVTGQVERLDSYRPIRFLPSIAARDRRPLLNGLKYFMDTHPASRYFRYGVFSDGSPIPAFGNLRERQMAFSRKISKWAHVVRAEWGIEVLFRGTEFTRKTAEERGLVDSYADPTTPLYHLHSNVIFWPTRKLSAAEWGEFLKYTWLYMNAHWQDNGKLRDANEIVKYVMKPNDLDSASDEELVWLFEQTNLLKISSPMGGFRDFMKSLKEGNQKVIRLRSSDGDPRGRLVKVKKAERLNHWKKDKAVALVDGDGEVMSSSASSSDQPMKNLFLGTCLPQWRYSPWSEPMILVQGYDPAAQGDACSRSQWERLQADIHEARAVALADWKAAGAPDPALALEVASALKAGRALPASFRVHNASSTVPAVADPRSLQTPEERKEVEKRTSDVLAECLARLKVRNRIEMDERKAAACLAA